MNLELLWVFIPTIAAISLTPSMCMTPGFHAGSLSKLSAHAVDDGR